MRPIVVFASQDYFTDGTPSSELLDPFPYGLQKLESDDFSVSKALRPTVTRLPRPKAVARARRRDSLGPGAIFICWDESITTAMIQRRRTADVVAGGIIWATDEWLSGERRLRSLLVKRYLLRADVLWCLARPQVTIAREWLGQDAPEIFWLPFGINVEYFSPAPYPDGPTTILSVGGDRDRDTATLYAACERLSARYGDEIRIIVQTANDLRPPRCVKRVMNFTHPELRDAYRAAHVVVVATLPNVHVSGMTVSLEAQATARPVVVSLSPGLEDYVVEGVTGFTPRQGDPADIADRVGAIIGNRDAARAMGTEARRHVVANHTTATMADALRDRLMKLSFGAGRCGTSLDRSERRQRFAAR